MISIAWPKFLTVLTLRDLLEGSIVFGLQGGFVIVSSYLEPKSMSKIQLLAAMGLWVIWLGLSVVIFRWTGSTGSEDKYDTSLSSNNALTEAECFVEISFNSLDAQLKRMMEESDQRMAEFELEMQHRFDQYPQPTHAEDVLDRLYDLDPNATATREADGSLTIRLRPKLSTTPE